MKKRTETRKKVAIARNGANGRFVSVNTMEDAERFRKAADDYAAKATRNKNAARKTLIDLGIYTKSGRLSKHYR